MGRKLKPITDRGPVGEHAQKLRDRRVPGRSYRAMADKCNFSHSVLADAAAGERFPTWAVTRGFLTACDADQAEILEWEKDWKAYEQRVLQLETQLGVAAVGATQRLRHIQPDVAGADTCKPHPENVNTYLDLRYEIQVLKIRAGDPALRPLAKAMDG